MVVSAGDPPPFAAHAAGGHKHRARPGTRACLRTRRLHTDRRPSCGCGRVGVHARPTASGSVRWAARCCVEPSCTAGPPALTARENRTAKVVTLRNMTWRPTAPTARHCHAQLSFTTFSWSLLARTTESQSWCSGGRAGTILSVEGIAPRTRPPASLTAFTSGSPAGFISWRGRSMLFATPKATRSGAGARLVAAVMCVAAALLRNCSIFAPRVAAVRSEGGGTAGDGGTAPKANSRPHRAANSAASAPIRAASARTLHVVNAAPEPANAVVTSCVPVWVTAAIVAAVCCQTSVPSKT